MKLKNKINLFFCIASLFTYAQQITGQAEFDWYKLGYPKLTVYDKASANLFVVKQIDDKKVWRYELCKYNNELKQLWNRQILEGPPRTKLVASVQLSGNAVVVYLIDENKGLCTATYDAEGKDPVQEKVIDASYKGCLGSFVSNASGNKLFIPKLKPLPGNRTGKPFKANELNAYIVENGKATSKLLNLTVSEEQTISDFCWINDHTLGFTIAAEKMEVGQDRELVYCKYDLTSNTYETAKSKMAIKNNVMSMLAAAGYSGGDTWFTDQFVARLTGQQYPDDSEDKKALLHLTLEKVYFKSNKTETKDLVLNADQEKMIFESAARNGVSKSEALKNFRKLNCFWATDGFYLAEERGVGSGQSVTYMMRNPKLKGNSFVNEAMVIFFDYNGESKWLKTIDRSYKLSGNESPMITFAGESTQHIYLLYVSETGLFKDNVYSAFVPKSGGDVVLNKQALFKDKYKYSILNDSFEPSLTKMLDDEHVLLMVKNVSDNSFKAYIVTLK